MGRITGVRNAIQLIQRRFRDSQHRPFCGSTEKSRRLISNSSNGKRGGCSGDISDVYRDLEKLDFMKAAKILFTHPPKTKKFGLDFHLVQLFFVCLPSLAVYLVAQYARYEMKKMDAELEVKKKAEEEVKEKEEAAIKEKEGQSANEILEMKERLQAIEKTVAEIAAETRQTKPANQKEISDDKEKSQNAGSSNTNK